MKFTFYLIDFFTPTLIIYPQNTLFPKQEVLKKYRNDIFVFSENFYFNFGFFLFVYSVG